MRLVPTQPKRLALLAYLALASRGLPPPRHFPRALLAGAERRRGTPGTPPGAPPPAPRRRRGDDRDPGRRPGGAPCSDASGATRWRFEEAVAGRPARGGAGLFRNEFLAGVHLPEVSVRAGGVDRAGPSRASTSLAGQAAAGALGSSRDRRGPRPERSRPRARPASSSPPTSRRRGDLSELLERRGIAPRRCRCMNGSRGGSRRSTRPHRRRRRRRWPARCGSRPTGESPR